MSIKLPIVTTLLRLYPAAWRREYGSELADLLLARPLSIRIVGDVVWSGMRQRVASAQPSTLCGLPAMLVIAAGVAWNMWDPSPSAFGAPAILRASTKTLPTVIVTPMESDLYGVLIAACGCWTYVRGGTLSNSGRAGVRMSFIAGIPVMVAGVFMLFGMITVDAQRAALSPLAVLTAPLFRLPASWMVGMIGGAIGRRASRSSRSRTAPTSM